jgi:hypothetical protein
MNEELPKQEEEEDVKNPLENFKNIFTNFEWGISLSVGGYLLLMFLGISYSFFYFMTFKINIFLFSEINDFLMAPLANPIVVGVALLSIGLFILLYQLSFFWMKKHFRSYQVFYRVMMLGRKADRKKINKMMKSPLYFVFAVVVYLLLAAELYGFYRSSKTLHDKNLFHYKLSVDKDLVKNIDSLVYVGDNSAHYFLFDTIKHEATVIPKEQVKYVRIMKNPKGRLL